jgi:hypothetical protein
MIRLETFRKLQTYSFNDIFGKRLEISKHILQ